MGTATKKGTSGRVKTTISNYNIDLNEEKLSEMVEDLGCQLIRFESTKKYFSSNDFEKMMLMGVVGLSAAKTGKYKELGFDCDEENKSFDLEDIVDKILEEIESNEDNEIFLSAFKLVMSEMLCKKKLDDKIFIEKFIAKSIELIIISESQAEFIQVYLADTKKEENFKEEIKKFSEKFVDKNFKNLIDKYNKKEKTIKDIIKKLQTIKPHPQK